MAGRIPQDELWRLRNEVDIEALIQHFAIPWKRRSGLLRFLCPLCGGFHTATNPKTNLARCFDCAKNFNPIDLTMREKECSFLEAVGYLREVLGQGRLKKDHRLS
jgi:hypothetical protein